MGDNMLLMHEALRLENNIKLNSKNLNFPRLVNEIIVFIYLYVNVLALDNENNIDGPYYFFQQENFKHIVGSFCISHA